MRRILPILLAAGCHSSTPDTVVVLAQLSVSSRALHTDTLTIHIDVDGEVDRGVAPIGDGATTVAVDVASNEEHEFRVRVTTTFYGESEVTVLQSFPKRQTITESDDTISFGPADFDTQAGQDGDGIPDWTEFSYGCHPAEDDCHWRAVSSGNEHTCAISMQDQLYCWGRNGSGQLGNDSFDDAVTPHGPLVDTEARWNAVSAGGDHTCAIAADDSVWCWGYGFHGQLGSGAGQDSSIPYRLEPEFSAQAIANGEASTCAIASTGALYCWGANIDGGVSSNIPQQMGTSVAWTDLAVGNQHACGVEAGTVWCWGHNEDGQVGIAPEDPAVRISFSSATEIGRLDTDNPWVDVEAGALNTCAINDRGELWCWGDPSSRKLGAIAPAQPYQPTQIQGSSPWRSVSVGAEHLCATREGNSSFVLECWGNNKQGRVGHGDLGSAVLPATPANDGIWSVSAGASHTCAVRNGDLLCWGPHGWGKTGLGVKAVVLGDSAPMMVPTPESFGDANWDQVDAGVNHTCAVATNGSLLCWGDNTHGGLGQGDTIDSSVPLEVAHPEDVIWSQVACGNGFTCALDNADGLYCWGLNDSGQLGIGTDTDAMGPQSVGAAPAGGTWEEVVAGGRHACARAANNENFELYCWGDNSLGAIGQGTTTESYSSPAQITEATSWLSVSAGDGFTCGVSGNNTRWCWGYNNTAQLGLSDIAQRLSPSNLNGETQTWTTVAVGGAHACGIETGDILYCWGDNSIGQVGNNGDVALAVAVPTAISGNFSTIAAGDQHTCAIASSGNAMHCWGSNWAGQLGLNDESHRSQPSVLPGSWSQVAAGEAHTCAIDTTTRLHCWGSNEIGQLGLDNAWAAAPEVLVQ